jgi:hypothetical protein
VGTTPEAPTQEIAFGGKKPEQILNVGKKEMRETWERLNMHKDNVVEHVAFGCPHCTIDEIGQLAAKLEGKKTKVPLLIGASIPVEALARVQGYADTIEKAGGRFLFCCPSVSNPFARKDFAGKNRVKSVAVDSARAAYYVAGVVGADTFFGTRDECIRAAVTGKWEGGSYED